MSPLELSLLLQLSLLCISIFAFFFFLLSFYRTFYHYQCPLLKPLLINEMKFFQWITGFSSDQRKRSIRFCTLSNKRTSQSDENHVSLTRISSLSKPFQD